MITRTIRCHWVSSNPSDDGRTLANPIANVPLTIASGTLSGSFSAPPLNLEHLEGWSFTAIVGGQATGSIGIFYSNDLDSSFNGTSVTNWVEDSRARDGIGTISGSMVAAGNMELTYFKWAQMRWNHTAGTGSIDIYVCGKG